MKLGDKIPVPELDELRVARLERAIVSDVSALPDRPRAGHSLMRFAVASVAVAGVILAIALNLRGAQSPATEPARITAQETEVVTGPDQSSRLVLGDAVVDVAEDTELRVEQFSDGRTILHLSTGRVACEVQPRPNRPTFQVLSGDVTVTVVGTAFTVARTRIVDVSVERGIVAVETSNESLKLHAGNSWRGSPFANQTLTAILAQIEAERVAAEAVAVAVAAPEELPTKVRPNRHRNQHLPKNPQPKNTSGEEPVLLSEILKDAKPLPPIFKKSHNPALAKLQHIAASNPAKAAVELEALAAKSTGPEASFALYSRAYLLFFKLHKNAAVAKAAQQYARRFPRGAEAEDMLWLRVRSSCDANRYASCRTAAHTYLRRYPSGIFQGLASRIIKSTQTE